ncbi:hypothetical protein AB7C87_07535 [Natrarchaeobius sp. A-rgal3]|uniref:hypothetical protein n=1 Tax=Natrarchaeobius versutus TaxID=1679078 RepID=UPI0035105CA3
MIERKHAEYARELRQEGDLSLAGEHYTSSAYGYLMRFRKVDRNEPEALAPPMFGKFATNLFLGALCHRIAGDLERSNNQCKVAIFLIKDIRDHVPRFSGRSGIPMGLCHELIGDFRLLGGFDSHDIPYQEAKQVYSRTDNDRQWSAEPEFEIQMMLFIDLAESVGFDFSEEEKEEIQYLSLEKRIQYKRNNFSLIIDQVIEAGNWKSDRF